MKDFLYHHCFLRISKSRGTKDENMSLVKLWKIYTITKGKIQFYPHHFHDMNLSVFYTHTHTHIETEKEEKFMAFFVDVQTLHVCRSMSRMMIVAHVRTLLISLFVDTNFFPFFFFVCNHSLCSFSEIISLIS